MEIYAPTWATGSVTQAPPLKVVMNWLGSGDFQILSQTTANLPAEASYRQVADFWVMRLLGRAATANTQQALVAFLSQGNDPDTAAPLAQMEYALQTLVVLIAMTPEFLER